MKSAVVFTALVAAASALAPLHVNEQAIDGKFIVVFKKTSTLSARKAHMEKIKGAAATDKTFAVEREFNIMQFHAYSGPMSPATVNMIRTDDDVVDFVEADSVMSTQAPTKKDNVVLYPQSVNATKSADQCQAQLEATWGLVRTGERELNINGEYYYEDTNQGEGVDAYILDTGIYLDHIEFEGRAVWGTDTVDNPSPRTDGNGHGTHVAGTVMSAKYGIAKKATGIAVKVLGASGSGSTAGVIDGVDWTCSDHQAKRNKCVANMSLGGGFSAAMNRAVEEATECGCSFAVASGNSAANACLYSPASADGAVVSVNSMDSSDRQSSFSNHGACTDIYAPGSSITSTWIGSRFAINTISGTSMASPHVCGIQAKLAEKIGDDPATIKSALLRDATMDAITSTSPNTPNALAYASC